ncbi:MAG: hypothetical protein AB7P21_19735 [Lautropia sp.]
MFARLSPLAAVVALSLAAATAHAQSPGGAPATPGVDKRQANQERRIEQGVASGQLTPREAQRMERQQARVARAEEKAKADGTVTAKERARLHRAEDRTSRHIHRQKHDGQKAAKP